MKWVSGWVGVLGEMMEKPLGFLDGCQEIWMFSLLLPSETHVFSISYREAAESVQPSSLPPEIRWTLKHWGAKKTISVTGSWRFVWFNKKNPRLCGLTGDHIYNTMTDGQPGKKNAWHHHWHGEVKKMRKCLHQPLKIGVPVITLHTWHLPPGSRKAQRRSPNRRSAGWGPC